jgi:hypothetical protein
MLGYRNACVKLMPLVPLYILLEEMSMNVRVADVIFSMRSECDSNLSVGGRRLHFGVCTEKL